MHWFFFRRLVCFSIGFLAFLLFLFLVLRQADRFWNQKSPNPPPIVIFGSSHAEVSINDALLSQKLSIEAKNWGLSGQGVFWSTQAAKKSIHQGSRLILFELNNFSYTSLENNISPAALIRETGSMYYLSASDWAFLISNAPKTTLDYFIKMPFPSRSMSGKYMENKRWLKNKELPARKKFDSFHSNISDTALHTLIQAHPKVNFVVFRAPQHPYFYIGIGPQNEHYFQKRFNLFKQYANCQALDFGPSFDADSVFADFGHLNLNGARILTEMLADSLVHFGLNIDNKH
jgi:hypothetical protein